MNEVTLTVLIDGETSDLSLWAVGAGAPGDVPIIEGRKAGAGELVVDVSAKAAGFEIESTVTLVETDRDLAIVGFTDRRQSAVLPTGYTPYSYQVEPGLPRDLSERRNPINLIAVDVDEGANLDIVISAINDSVRELPMLSHPPMPPLRRPGFRRFRRRST